MPNRLERQELVLDRELAPVGSAGLQSGIVLRVSEDGRSVAVRVGATTIDATTAVGCLVRPIANDLVLVHVAAADAYVLSVLERVGPNYATITLPGNGSLAIEAENVAVTGRQRVAINGATIDVTAKTLAFIAQSASWLGTVLGIVVDRFQASAKTHETSADLVVTKTTNRVAVVDQSDSLKAGAHSLNVSGISTETAESKVIIVTEDLRMDGKRVTMG